MKGFPAVKNDKEVQQMKYRLTKIFCLRSADLLFLKKLLSLLNLKFLPQWQLSISSDKEEKPPEFSSMFSTAPGFPTRF